MSVSLPYQHLKDTDKETFLKFIMAQLYYSRMDSTAGHREIMNMILT